MTGKMRIMGRAGHTTVDWCTDLQETVEAANRRFNELQADGYTAFAMVGATTGEQIEHFDADLPTIVMVPRMVAG